MEGIVNSSSHSLYIAGGFATLYFAYQIVHVVYSIFFHPLSSVPGPWYAAAFRLPYIRHSLDGSLLPWLQELHEKYGEIVRYSPNEVSVISGKENPWQDVYGFRTGKQKHTGTFEKDPVWYPPPVNKAPSILQAPASDHGRQRRILSHAFSDKALRDQEGLIQSYVDLLISRLRDISERQDPEYNKGGDGWDAKGTVELCKWYNGLTFDIISDLCFGEPFGSLANMHQHVWVGHILESLKGLKLFYVMRHWPWTQYLGSLIIKKDKLQKRVELNNWIREKTIQRVNTETQRPDFITAIAEHQNGRFGGEDSKEANDLRMGELVSNVGLFLIAGTETTATTLSIGSYLLLKHPEVLDKLKSEIRNRFKSDSEITIDAVSQCEYLTAVIHEIMRFFPPVPAGFLRKVPETGAEVAGVHLSGNSKASISVNQYIANRSSLNFADPECFIPERWLSSPPEKYKNDNFAVVQPFSFGPRNCLGKNLAYAELRLVFTKMVWNFDWTLDERSEGWDKRIAHHTLFFRPDLWVKLTPVREY